MADGGWFQRRYARLVFSKIIAEAWQDSRLKSRLLSDPKAVLREKGIEVPDDVRVVAHENTPSEFHFIIPERPDLRITDLEAADRRAFWCSEPWCTWWWCSE